MVRTQLCSLETIRGVKCREDISGGEWGKEMKWVRGMMHAAAGVKDLGVISSSPGGSHLTDRLREVSGRRGEVEE